MSKIKPQDFQQRLLCWYQQNGRKDLPWKTPGSAYQVWLSEIMLQQTQVSTVLPYFERFIQKFPNIKALADAPVDDVLALWSGLGYYARARNLHKTAQIIVTDYEGKFPESIEQLIDLPGIGRSTAGAIASFGFNRSAPILDGNVKRVLARIFGIEGWPGKTSVAYQLWELSETFTPQASVADYNQAIMDLGAMVCTRSNPQCQTCPMKDCCFAHLSQSQSDFPGKKPKVTKPIRATQMVIIMNNFNQYLLYQRPNQGIWGGLWSFPEIDVDTDAKTWSEKLLNIQTNQTTCLEPIKHIFTHFQLNIHPTQLYTQTPKPQAHDNYQWVDSAKTMQIGLPAPVKKLIRQIQTLEME